MAPALALLRGRCGEAIRRLRIGSSAARQPVFRLPGKGGAEAEGNNYATTVISIIKTADLVKTATGENLFSHQDARNLLRYAGMRPDRDVLQFDCALSYGLVEYVRTLDVMRECGRSWRQVVPHGGHQMSLNIAAGLGLGGNESYPGVFQPFGGFADDLAVDDGHVRLPDAPGIGFERQQALYALMRRLAE